MGSNSPSMVGQSSEKLKLIVMDNVYNTKGSKPNDYSFDYDSDTEKTIASKMNTG